MALKPFRECKCLGCHNLTRDTYCEVHMHMKIDEEKKRQVYYDMHKRNKVTRKYYQSKEHKLWVVAVKRKAKGLCELCSTIEAPVIGSEADHIIPIDTPEGWSKRMDLSNGQLLCHNCHMNKTAKDLKNYLGKRTVR